MSTCAKIFGGLSHLFLASSLAVVIAGLSQQNYVTGYMYFYYDSNWHNFNFGLFNSCIDGSCDGSSASYWSYGFARPLSLKQQWQAAQAFILAEIILRGFAWLAMLFRGHLEEQYPLKHATIHKTTNILHILTVVTGTIATAVMGSMPQRLLTDLGSGYAWYGTSATLQFVAYGVGMLGFFAHMIARRYDPAIKAAASAAPLLGQQVAVVVNGQTFNATITGPVTPALVQVPYAQMIQPVAQPQPQHYHANPVYAQPINVVQPSYVPPQATVPMYTQPPMYY